MTATFYVGDAIEVMSKLPEKSVDLVLTSPPFLALRSYLPADHPDKALEGGSQATPGLFIDWLIDVVEACDRVLAPHGSLCIELGDTYAGSGGAGGDYGEGGLRERQEKFIGSGRMASGAKDAPQDDGGYSAIRYEGHGSGIRNMNNKIQPSGPGWPLAKSLSLIPELFRFTLVYGFNPLTGRQTERWRLRNVVRWVRPNPPVGALGDKFRPATSELMVFCKSAKRYFDLDAVREPGNPDSPHGVRRSPDSKPQMVSGQIVEGKHRNPLVLSQKEGTAGAPPLDWWKIPPGGYEGAHYAVWPPELLIKPVKAMSPEKVCRVCGEPSKRIVELGDLINQNGEVVNETPRLDGRQFQGSGSHGKRDGGITRSVNTLGFSDCGHDDYRNGLVLDPFGGSGTTALVATGHGRDAILIDIDDRNVALARDRIGPFFFEVIDGRETERPGDSILASGGPSE